MRVPIPVDIRLPGNQYQSGLGRWLAGGPQLEEEHSGEEPATHPWYKVLWLTGVDYFSTLGYQPGIALLAAGAVAPLATAILVVVTLLGALPIYAQVARRSYAGQGSIAMLEHLLPGWKGKVLVLVLLGFAATDFVITMTLSAADAATHAIENPLLNPYIGHHQVLFTLAILIILAIVFLKGFQEAIGVATAAAVPYLFLNVVVLSRGLWEVFTHPEVLPNWKRLLEARGDWTGLAIAATLIFPKLALGLSGFETGVSVMPLIQGLPPSRRGPIPVLRIANTQKLLATAALIMSVMLVFSSFVTTLLIPEADYQRGGDAAGRAIAFLAHKYLGTVFGTVYDISTIIILGLAGASAMAGLLHLIPRYLPRFGMAPQWVKLSRPLVLVLLLINLLVTIAFQADVEAQSGAYATGVLVLILSAAFATTLALWREKRRLVSCYFGFLTLVFLYTLVDNCIERPDGLIIGSIFIVLVMIVSAVSRSLRSIEFRVSKLYWSEPKMADLLPEVKGRKVNLVPLRSLDPGSIARKRAELQKHFRVEGTLLFVTVKLRDNRSEFATPLELELRREGQDFILEVHGANTIANTLAYLSEWLDPVSIFLGLTRENLMQQALRYLFWGEGETGLLVYTVLLNYWEWTPEDDVRPLIFLMSD